MKIIAITGGLASGKTTVANIFQDKYNIPIIDTDQIARDLINPDSSIYKSDLFNKIIDKFSNDIIIQDINNNNKLYINRKKLSNLVFNNKNYKKWIEELLHPEINNIVNNNINKLNNNYKYCIILVPLLTKEYLKNNLYINKVISVECDLDTQVTRAMARDNKSKAEVMAIISQQLNNQQRLELKNYIDYYIIINNNNNNNNNLDKQIDELDKLITSS